MARDPKQLRKAYEYKLGKDLVKNLSDAQISELSKYYNSLTPAQQSEVDSETVMGKGEFLNTARSMADPLKYPSNQSVLPAQKNKNEDLSKVEEKKPLPKIKRKPGRPLKNKRVNLPEVSTTPEAIVSALLGIENVNIQDTEKQSIEDENISIDDIVGENDPSSIVEGVTPKYDFDEFVEEVNQKISPEKLFDTKKDDTVKEKPVTVVKDNLDKDKFKSEILRGVENLISQLKTNKPQSDKILPKNNVVTEYKEVEKIVEVSPKEDDREKLLKGIDFLLKDIRGEEKTEEKSKKKEKKSQTTEKDVISDNIDSVLEKIKEYKKLSSSTSTEKVVEEVVPDDLISDVKKEPVSLKPTEEVEPEDEEAYEDLDDLLNDVREFKSPSERKEEEVEPEDKDVYEDLDDLLSDVKKDTPSLKPIGEVEPEDKDAYEDLDDLLSDVKKDTPSLKPTEEIEPEDESTYEDLDDLIKDVRELKSSNEKKEEEVEPEDESAFEKLDELLTEVKDNTDTLKPRDTDETSDDDDYDDEDNKITQIETILVDIKKNIEDSQEEQSQKIENIEILLKEINEKDEEETTEDDRDIVLQDIENLLIEIREEQNNKDEESDTTESDDEEIADSIDGMNETLAGIDSLLKDILGQEKEEDQREKTEAQKSGQQKEEQDAEKTAKKSAFGALKKIKVPKLGFFDKIKRFFTNILLGSVVLKILDWVNDPKNQETIDNIVNFVTNNMDKILIGLATLVGLDIGLKIVGFLTTFVPLIKGILALFTGPLGFITLIASLPFIITKALQRPLEDAILKNYENKYGKDYAEEGAFITKLGDQYGRIASRQDKEKLLDDDEKLTGFYIAQYDKALQDRKRLSDNIKRDTATLNNPDSDRRSKNAASKRLNKDKKSLKTVQEKIKNLKSQIIIDGKSLETLKQEFVSDLTLPQTGLSKKLYPNSGTGKEMSGVPEYFGSEKKSNKSKTEASPSQQQEDLNRVMSENDFNTARIMDPNLPDTYEDYLKQNQNNEPPIISPLSKLMPSTEPTGVKKVIIGAGHAPTPENAARGIPLGSDNKNVQGTADDGSSGGNTNPTGVTEWQATKQVVDALKMMVKDRGLEDKIGFEDIYSFGGLTDVPRRVEGKEGQQYVDLHFDARGFGKEGVLPSRNESATDKSLMDEFGRYSSSFDPSSKGVTRGGGTLVELGRIDDPKIRGLLEEVKRGEIGPETNKMAERVLRGIVPSIESKPKKDNTQASLPLSKDMKTKPVLPSPPSSSIDIAALPMGGMGGNNQKQLSSSSQASQKGIQVFSPIDLNNMTITSVKSIYNVIA